MGCVMSSECLHPCQRMPNDSKIDSMKASNPSTAGAEGYGKKDHSHWRRNGSRGKSQERDGFVELCLRANHQPTARSRNVGVLDLPEEEPAVNPPELLTSTPVPTPAMMLAEAALIPVIPPVKVFTLLSFHFKRWVLKGTVLARHEGLWKVIALSGNTTEDQEDSSVNTIGNRRPHLRELLIHSFTS